MFFHKVPPLIRNCYPSLTWSLPADEKVIYLTFDDGPIPEVTEYILETLDTYKARATFFCVGENLIKYPDIATRAVNQGHRLANHSQNHLNGWKNEFEHYVQNIEACEKNLEAFAPSARLFRPPYGRITRKQIRQLSKEYWIVMWSVLTGDFSSNIRPEACLKNSIKATSRGSIVVFHDNIKAETNLKYALPRYLEHFSEKGYEFKTIDDGQWTVDS